MRYGWSLDPGIWETAKDILDSDGWNFCKFIADSKEIVPPARGIYILVSSPPDERQTALSPLMKKLSSPIYVGHSINLRRRFSDHISFKDGSIANSIKPLWRSTHFWFHEMAENREMLRSHEQSLIDVFGPPANRINSQVLRGTEITGKFES